MITLKFEQTEDFEAFRAATDWCNQNGVSYGIMQRDDPIGLMRGEYDISKWRNLSKKDIASLDGTIEGDKRNGPVTIQIKERENG